MIKHDLIEQVGGIERAKAIVEGAPEGATLYVHEKSKIVENLFGFYADGFCVGIHNPHTHFKLNDLRTAIAEYEQGSNSSEFKVRDLVVYHSIESHKNLFSVRYVGGDSITVYECLDEMGAKTFSEYKPYSDIRHATPAEIAAGHRIDKKIESDDVKDIKNHISPNTKVINHG